jgi:uncharacterized membrane-anchored protein
MHTAIVCRFALATLVLASGGLSATRAEEKKEPIQWTRGPAKVDVGDNLGEVKLSDRLVFAGKADTERLMREMGNPTNGSELGLVTSRVEGENWFVVFEWRGVGLVKDDERNEIDADALLKNIQRASEAANEKRKKQGSTALHVTGWAEPPHYDTATHNLTWAIRGKTDDGDEVVNYNVRLLGREGVMSVTLVDEPNGLATAKPRVDAVIQGFTFKRGKTYAEWVPGDKVAAYGLTALIAAGAGAAAVKTGLLAALGGMLVKAWKALVLAVIAAGATIARSVKRLFGGREAHPIPPPPTGSDNQV